MKTYFKTMLVAIALLFGTSAYALIPVGIGVKGGMNLSNFGGDLDDTSAKVGFNGGLLIDIDIPFTSFGVLTGIEFSTKGAKADAYRVDLNGNLVSKEKVSIPASYLQLPAHLSYKLDVLPATKVIFHGGPYIAYGIGGKVKDGGEKYDTFGDDGFDRFDWGLGLGAGVRIWKFGVDLGYDFGLKNISGDSDIKVRNQNAYLSVYYMFM